MKCLIKKAMDMNRVGGGVIVYVILVCILATGYSEGGRRRFNDNGDGLLSPEIDEYTAEQIWKHCRQELMDMKETLADYGLYDNEDSTGELLSSNLHEAINSLPLQIQHSLFTCLRNKIMQANRNWISEYLELIFSWPSTPRRYLVSNTGETVSDSNAPSPAPSNQAPSPAPSNQAPSPAPAFAPGPALYSPSYSPTIAPTPDPEPPSEAPDVISAPPPLKRTHYLPPFRKDDEDQKRKLATIAASLLVILVLLFASLLILCDIKRGRNKVDPQGGQKTEKPLLNLPLSDFSNGSSPQSDNIGNSGDKEFGVTSKLATMSYTMAQTPSSEGLSKNAIAPIPLPPLMAPPGKKVPLPPGPPPPPAPKSSTGPPPPPPKVTRPPPAPPGNLKKIPPSPLGPGVIGGDTKVDSDAPKTKLKPFFWDKVQANPDQSMVWHEINAGSFQFNEKMMESLFGYAPERNKNNRKSDTSSSTVDGGPQFIQIIDSRKAQNLSILLRALNVTSEEVCDALREGTELPIELVQTLLKMAPTNDEELKLRLFSGELSHLGPAERFLKVLVEIPFAFKRLESLLFMSSVQEEVLNAKESFATLEVACNKLKNSRLFLKLLEAVLKTGNRMNDGTYRGGAQAFKLDTLLKLSDVKGTDGKTTLLHFVVQEIIRSEGIKVARANGDSTRDIEEHYRSIGLQVVSSVSTELEDVKKAAVIDTDGLMSTVSKLGHTLMKNQNFLNFEMKNLEEESEFHSTVSNSVDKAGTDIKWLIEEEKKIMALVKNTAEYFYGQSGKDEGLRLFVIVRDFLVMLDKACKEVKDDAAKKLKMVIRKEASTSSESSSEARQTQLSDIHRRLFPAIIHRRVNSFGSEDDTESP